MTVCTHLSDRMPDVALGRVQWTADDERHLAGCADCRAEWAIVSAASRLGATLPAVDPARTTARALERIRHERAHARIRARQVAVLAGLAAAAVLALALWAGRGGRGTAPGGRTLPAPAPVATTPAPDDSGNDSQVQRSPAPRLAQGPTAPLAAELPMPELDSLPAEALDSILRELDEPLAHVGAYDLPPDDSGDRELEQVLAGLEG
jgi:hypothetical protein